MEQKDYEFLKGLLHEHGVRGGIRGLSIAMKMYADDLSDLNIKDESREAAEFSEILSDLLVE